MKLKWEIIQKYSPWLFVLLSMDVFFCLLLWIADIQALIVLSLTLVLLSVLIFTAILFLLFRREMRFRNCFETFVHAPDEVNEEELLLQCSKADKAMMRLLGEKLRRQKAEQKMLLTRVCEYEEYVETWAHETKTPISLLGMLLDNWREEIPKNVVIKLDYVRNHMQEYVNQMLFYARLKGEKKDYFFEEVNLSECLEEILEDYKSLLEEKKFQTELLPKDEMIYSDKRGLRFILSQIISNSLKYTKDKNVPILSFSYCVMDKNSVLSVADNGIGVRESDLPYIFEKGFTGDTGESRKHATGMGLYLAYEMAKDLGLSLEADSNWGNGFSIKISFPMV